MSRAVELGHLLDGGVDRERDEVVRARVDERALARAPDRRAVAATMTASGIGLSSVNALSPVKARPMISFWIWLVPSYSVVTRASRRYLPTGYSST